MSGKSVLIIVVVYAVIVLLAVLAGKYLVDFNQLFEGIIHRLSDHMVVTLFFLSESFLGMIPVDLFVIWTQKFDHPLPWLALLGGLSYTGGVISYGIGKWISRRKRIREFTEKRLERYTNFVRKWGRRLHRDRSSLSVYPVLHGGHRSYAPAISLPPLSVVCNFTAFQVCLAGRFFSLTCCRWIYGSHESLPAALPG